LKVWKIIDLLQKSKENPPQSPLGFGGKLSPSPNLPGGLGRVFSPSPSDLDPPKSPLKRGTLTEFSPLFKGGWGGSPGLKTDPRVGYGSILARGLSFNLLTYNLQPVSNLQPANLKTFNPFPASAQVGITTQTLLIVLQEQLRFFQSDAVFLQGLLSAAADTLYQVLSIVLYIT